MHFVLSFRCNCTLIYMLTAPVYDFGFIRLPYLGFWSTKDPAVGRADGDKDARQRMMSPKP